jgi:hypothetical protein
MSIKSCDPVATATDGQLDDSEGKESYSPPQLIHLGNLKDVVAGGNSGPPEFGGLPENP